MKRWSVRLVFILFVLHFFFGLLGNRPVALSRGVSPEPVSAGQSTVRLIALGDVVMHMPIVDSCQKLDGYDFRPIFADLKPILENADFVSAVLEAPLGGANVKYTGYPSFNSPGAIADALQWAGVDLLCTAHNHMLDRGIGGLTATVDYLDQIGISHTGSRSRPGQPRFFLGNVKGLTIAFLSYTTTTNGIGTPTGWEWAVNRFDYSKIAADITEARNSGADCIIFALHTGIEYQRLPSRDQQAMVERLLGMGVDIVLGSHVHVIQPLEGRRMVDPLSNQTRQCFVAYSLGNLLSNQRWRYSDCGLLLSLQLQKKVDGPGVHVAAAYPVPLWVNKYSVNGRYRYRILPLVSPDPPIDPTIDETAQQRIREVWAETFELLDSWKNDNFERVFTEVPLPVK